MNQLLTEMDGLGAKKAVFVIGATNRPDIRKAEQTEQQADNRAEDHGERRNLQGDERTLKHERKRPRSLISGGSRLVRPVSGRRSASFVDSARSYWYNKQ